MSNLFPPHPPRSVHASPPTSPQQGGSNRSRQGWDRERGGSQRELKPQDSSSRDRRKDDSFYERRPRSQRDPDESVASPNRSSYVSRYVPEDDPFIAENPEWVRKSSRQRRFTQTTLPTLHTRENIAREEIDFDDTEREQVLGDMSERMNEMSGYVSNVVQRKEEDLKFMAELFDEDGNPIPRYDEEGNPISPHDEDGHSMDGWDRHEEDTRKAKMVTIDTSKMSIKEGWLWKKGAGGGVFGRRNWTRRYFKFDMFQVVTVYYFKQQMPSCSEIRQGETKEQYQKRKKQFFSAQKQYARGYVKLMYATLEIPERRRHQNPNINPDWEFDVVIPNSRAFSLCAESQEDFEKWTQTFDYITSTIQKARGEIGKPRIPRAIYDEKKRDAALCITAYGKGLFESVAGHQSEFTIQGFDFEAGVPAMRGGQKLTAVMESRDLHYDLPIRDNQDGTYSVTYTPTRVGTYELSVMLDDYDIQGSPFHPSVRPAPVSAPHCVTDGAGLFCAVVGAVNRFNIHTRNAFNQIVVARGVPFELEVQAPLVLCNVDGSRLSHPSEWRPHDNGNGTYAVAYLVEPKEELLDRLTRGEHFEGMINVTLNDHIHTPSFSRSIKGAPFHPVLAASATGAALASAARHAALLLGPNEYNDFVSSFIAQSGGSYGSPSNSSNQMNAAASRFSDLRLPPTVMPSNQQPAASTIIPGGGKARNLNRGDDDEGLEESSSYYVKESPIPKSRGGDASAIHGERTGPGGDRRRLDESFSSSTMRQQQQRDLPNESFTSVAPRNEYLPVRQQQRSRNGAEDSALSPDQREALNAEREELLRLRRQLAEGKSLADEQVSRMAYMEQKSQQQRNSVDPSRSYNGITNDQVPPPSQYVRTSRPAPIYGSTGSPSSYDRPPQRIPPSNPASPPMQQRAFDPTVQALFAKYAVPLKKVYRHYLSRDAASGLDLVHVGGFVRCLTDFDVTPTFASRKEVREAFAKALGGNEYGGADFTSFVEALGHVAMSALSKPTFASLYPSPGSKVQVLLTMWGLGDSATFEGVMQKQRFARAL